MSNRQVDAYKSHAATQLLDVARCLDDGNRYIDQLLEWTIAHINDPLAPLIYATQPADVLKSIQQTWGEHAASKAIEQTFAQLSQKLQVAGVNTFIVAGEKLPGL